MITRDQIIEAARGYVGTLYKAGGNTSDGLSCAGLLVIVGRDTGYLTEEIPGFSNFNEAEPMRKWFDLYLDEIEIADVQPGDVLSMEFDAGLGEQHCAFVSRTDGRGLKYWYVIHSLRNHGVVEGRLFGSYLRNVKAAFRLKGIE